MIQELPLFVFDLTKCSWMWCGIGLCTLDFPQRVPRVLCGHFAHARRFLFEENEERRKKKKKIRKKEREKCECVCWCI